MVENFIAIKCTCYFKITFYTWELVGSVTCPVNNVNLDSLSLIRNKKGRSQTKGGMGNDGADKGTNWGTNLGINLDVTLELTDGSELVAVTKLGLLLVIVLG